MNRTVIMNRGGGGHGATRRPDPVRLLAALLRNGIVAAPEEAARALLTAASWLLGRLPGMVVEHQAGEVARTLAAAHPLIIEITPAMGVRIKSGDRLLL